MALVASEVTLMFQDISDRFGAGRKRFDQALLQINAVIADIGAIQTQYGDILSELDASPGGTAQTDAWKDLKTQLVAEGASILAEAQLRKAALEGV